MTSNIAAILAIPATPARQQPADASQGASQNSSSSALQTTQNSDQSSANQLTQNNSNNNTGSFSSLLQPSQKPNTPDASTPAAPAQNNTPTTPQNNTANDNGSSKTADANIAQVVLLVQSQLLASGAGNTQNTTNAAAQAVSANTTTSLSAQDNNLLSALQKILQTLLQQATTLGQNTQSGKVASPSDNSANSQQGGNTIKTSEDAITAALSQLLSVLAQISKQPEMMQSLTQQLNSLTVTGDGKNAADILSQLANALQAKLGVATGNIAGTADNQKNGQAGADSTPNSNANTASNPFEQLVNVFAAAAKNAGGNTDSGANTSTANTSVNATGNATSQLQAALTNIMNILTPAQGVKQENSNTNSDTSNNSAAISQVVSTGTHAPQTTGSEFVKFANPMPQPATPLADQVLVQIKTAAATGTSQIKIQLDPESLGKVEVQMVTGTDGKTGVTITADNRQTLAMLQSEARSLESALRDVGLKTDAGGLNFNLRGGQQQNGGNSGGNHGGYTQVAAIGTEDDLSDIGAITTSYQLPVQQGLDIRV